MRKCWNWQTGMTKDHVSVGSEGSSPFSRIKKSLAIARDFFSFISLFYEKYFSLIISTGISFPVHSLKASLP